MKDISRLLLGDVIIMGSIPIGASLFDPEAAQIIAEIGIREIIFDRCAAYSRKKENEFINAVVLAQNYGLVQTEYGLRAEFEARAHVVMKDYVYVEENL